jgi:predicted aspartyl protease
METTAIGKVLVTVKIENLYDLALATNGKLALDAVRSVEVPDALVDTGATLLHVPKRLIQQLGLSQVRTRRVRTTARVIEVGIYDPVSLTIQGRDWTAEVAEVPDDCPVLVGQLPLEGLDFVVDVPGQKLIGNPAHGGEHMIEAYHQDSAFRIQGRIRPRSGRNSLNAES